jgi:hypothetical protein
MTLEQGATELRLKSLYRLAKRWLSDAEPFGGLTEMKFFGKNHKGSKVAH